MFIYLPYFALGYFGPIIGWTLANRLVADLDVPIALEVFPMLAAAANLGGFAAEGYVPANGLIWVYVLDDLRRCGAVRPKMAIAGRRPSLGQIVPSSAGFA